MDKLREQALKDINAIAHNKGSIKILDEDLYFYEFLVIEIIENDLGLTILKLLELSNTDFREDNKVYRFSLEELIEWRIFYLKKLQKENEKFKNLIPNNK